MTIKPDHDVDLAKLPPIRPRGTPGSGRRPTANGASGMLPLGWAVFAGLVGPAVSVFCLAVEPPPANPNAEPLVGTLLGFALLITWGGAAIAAGRRLPSALTWASVIGGLSLAMTISCPLSGHHTSIGMWWVGQFVVCAAAWAVAGIGKYNISRPRPEK